MNKREYVFVTKHDIKINTHELTAIIKKQVITDKIWQLSRCSFPA